MLQEMLSILNYVLRDLQINESQNINIFFNFFKLKKFFT